MSKIESIIEFECYDNKPSDCEWTLRKEDVPEIARNIKKLLIEEIKKAPHTFDDAVSYPYANILAPHRVGAYVTKPDEVKWQQ